MCNENELKSGQSCEVGKGNVPPGVRLGSRVTRRIAGAVGSAVLLAAAGFALSNMSPANAESEESQSKIGLRVAPVPLNMAGKDPELVGYGSFLVNVVADCNGCHTNDPSTQYAPGGNPYFSQKPAKTNPATYLGGGNDFGPLIPGTAEIITRNLTPDKTGMPAGGHTFKEFLTIIRTGADMDMIHPTCSGAPGPNCLLPPFDGSLLQIMPWPVFSRMSDHDIRAIYTYLSTIPCISGPPAPSNLHNDCQ